MMLSNASFLSLCVCMYNSRKNIHTLILSWKSGEAVIGMSSLNFFCKDCWTESKRFKLDSSSYFHVNRPYETWFKFFNHSKYETVTPPALMYKSGMTSRLRDWRILSAAGVVGPFAPSAMIYRKWSMRGKF